MVITAESKTTLRSACSIYCCMRNAYDDGLGYKYDVPQLKQSDRLAEIWSSLLHVYTCFPSHISDSMQALCSVWLSTNAHKWRCHNSMFKAHHLAKLCGKLRNIPIRENKSVRCVNPHFVTRVFHAKNTILCLIVLIWLKVLLPWDEWGNHVEWPKKNSRTANKNSKGNFLNTHNLSIRNRVFFWSW